MQGCCMLNHGLASYLQRRENGCWAQAFLQQQELKTLYPSSLPPAPLHISETELNWALASSDLVCLTSWIQSALSQSLKSHLLPPCTPGTLPKELPQVSPWPYRLTHGHHGSMVVHSHSHFPVATFLLQEQPTPIPSSYPQMANYLIWESMTALNGALRPQPSSWCSSQKVFSPAMIQVFCALPSHCFGANSWSLVSDFLLAQTGLQNRQDKSGLQRAKVFKQKPSFLFMLCDIKQVTEIFQILKNGNEDDVTYFAVFL